MHTDNNFFILYKILVFLQIDIFKSSAWRIGAIKQKRHGGIFFSTLQKESQK